MTKHTRSEESQESQINMSYELGEEGAVKALFTYYLRMRNGNLPKISREIPAEFIRIQKEILKVVELRK